MNCCWWENSRGTLGNTLDPGLSRSESPLLSTTGLSLTGPLAEPGQRLSSVINKETKLERLRNAPPATGPGPTHRPTDTEKGARRRCPGPPPGGASTPGVLASAWAACPPKPVSRSGVLSLPGVKARWLRARCCLVSGRRRWRRRPSPRGPLRRSRPPTRTPLSIASGWTSSHPSATRSCSVTM